MEAQRLGLGIGEAFAPAHGQKVVAGETDVVQQMIILAFQQERGRAAQLRKGERRANMMGLLVLETRR